MRPLGERLREARETSFRHFGKRVTFYLPGMITYNGLRGAYPGVSITGNRCALLCDHCRAKILEPMPAATSPDALLDLCRRLQKRGCIGILISGGSDREGRLPWSSFIPAIRQVKEETGLYISIHCGLLDRKTARALKEAGVDQALLDVVGDDATYREVCHVDFGISRIVGTLEALNEADLPVVPHVICGLYRGAMGSERKALEIISRFTVEQLVIVSLMAIRGTPFEGVRGPSAQEVGEIIVEARRLMPHVRTALGCARRRGDEEMERIALEAGVNRMALPSDAVIRQAEEMGLTVRYQRTCCSVGVDFSRQSW